MKPALVAISAAVLLAAMSFVQAADEGKPLQSPYAKWKNGPPADPGYFPIGVWLQDPKNASRYKDAGINLYIGLSRGPTEEQLALLKQAGVKVIVSQRKSGLALKDDPTIVGWMHGDEPDNAQAIRDPVTKKSKGYGPPIPPARIIEDYEKYRSVDPTRPVMLNLGQGVANDKWVGRGPQGKLEDYLGYVKGGDVISYDVYPVADSKDMGPEMLWLVAKGLDRLAKWSEGQRILWSILECTHINDANSQATPRQVRTEVWMSLVHGTKGIIYFVHQFKPTFNEHALLDDPEMLAEVTRTNKQIHSLAPVLNSPTLPEGVSVESSSAEVPIDAIAKRLDGATYVFSVGMRNAPAKGTFRVRDLPADATAEVIGEGRSIKVKDGRFEDDFGAYDVHLYKIR